MSFKCFKRRYESYSAETGYLELMCFWNFIESCNLAYLYHMVKVSEYLSMEELRVFVA